MNELIKDTYYDPSTGFQSANKLYQKLKSHGITLQQIKTFLNKQETQQLHKQPINQLKSSIISLLLLNMRTKSSKLI